MSAYGAIRSIEMKRFRKIHYSSHCKSQRFERYKVGSDELDQSEYLEECIGKMEDQR